MQTCTTKFKKKTYIARLNRYLYPHSPALQYNMCFVRLDVFIIAYVEQFKY